MFLFRYVLGNIYWSIEMVKQEKKLIIVDEEVNLFLNKFLCPLNHILL